MNDERSIWKTEELRLFNRKPWLVDLKRSSLFREERVRKGRENYAIVVV